MRVTLALSAAFVRRRTRRQPDPQWLYPDVRHRGAGVKTLELDGLGGADTFTFDDVLPIDITIAGGGGTDTLVGPADGTEWEVTGRRHRHVHRLRKLQRHREPARAAAVSTGSTSVIGGSISGQIDGGAGAGTGDVLIGPDADNTWSLTGADCRHAERHHRFRRHREPDRRQRGRPLPGPAGGSLSGLLDGGLDKAVDARRHRSGDRHPRLLAVRVGRLRQPGSSPPRPRSASSSRIDALVGSAFSATP